MDLATRELAALASPEDAARSMPSRGPEWDALVDLGVDVTLLLRNAKLTPAERLHQAQAHARFAEQVQSRTVATATRYALAKARLWEKIDALGGPDPAWPSELLDGR